MKRKILWGLAILLIFVSILPYFIPVTKATIEIQQPFPESQFATIDGVRLHYRIWIPDEYQTIKSKVLFVHGLAGSTFSWRENVEPLREAGHLVVAVDLPGFGYSDRSRGINHSQENRAHLLWGLLDQLQTDAPIGEANDVAWHLVGHSMGGGTVTAMALQKPEQAEAIIYIDAAVLSGGNPGGLFAKYPPMDRWVEVIGRNVLLKEQRIASFLTSAYGRPATEYEVQGYLEPLQLSGTEGSFVDIVRTSTHTTREELSSLQIPVKAIWGELDSWVSVEDAYSLAALIDNLDLFSIPNAYHCPMETADEEFNEILLELLRLQ